MVQDKRRKKHNKNDAACARRRGCECVLSDRHRAWHRALELIVRTVALDLLQPGRREPWDAKMDCLCVATLRLSEWRCLQLRRLTRFPLIERRSCGCDLLFDSPSSWKRLRTASSDLCNSILRLQCHHHGMVTSWRARGLRHRNCPRGRTWRGNCVSKASHIGRRRR